jgi:hypothetical protein
MTERILLKLVDFCYFCKMWVDNMSQYFSKRCENYIAYFGSFHVEIWNYFFFFILEISNLGAWGIFVFVLPFNHVRSFPDKILKENYLAIAVGYKVDCEW